MAPMDTSWILSVWTQPVPATLWLPTTPHPPPLQACGMAMPVKSYLKRRALQLAIHLTVGV